MKRKIWKSRDVSDDIWSLIEKNASNRKKWIKEISYESLEADK